MEKNDYEAGLLKYWWLLLNRIMNRKELLESGLDQLGNRPSSQAKGARTIV